MAFVKRKSLPIDGNYELPEFLHIKGDFDRVEDQENLLDKRYAITALCYV